MLNPYGAEYKFLKLNLKDFAAYLNSIEFSFNSQTHSALEFYCRDILGIDTWFFATHVIYGNTFISELQKWTAKVVSFEYENKTLTYKQLYEFIVKLG